MGEGNIFTLVSVHTSIGVGGTPSQVWMGGYPILGLDRGIPHPRSGWGVPQVWTEGYPRSGRGVPHPRSGWGVPHPRSGQKVTPWLGLDGVPPPTPGLDEVLPQPEDWLGYPLPPIGQSSIASTCYAASGMPLAFTQENFLVQIDLHFFFSGLLLTPSHCIHSKSSQRALDELQRTIVEIETKYKAEISRLKKKYETEIREYEIQVETLTRTNAELAKNNKALSSRVKVSQDPSQNFSLLMWKPVNVLCK